ncbi:MAG TPA: serine/threonine-protein kinase [Planctomycetota bacterium]|nr:serine/threonine-protein kinase [Planctomycetota bacterium]
MNELSGVATISYGMTDRELRRRSREAATADDPIAHLRLGLALFRTGDLEGARAALLRASELAPLLQAPPAALREVLAQVAARDLPDAEGRIGRYAIRQLLRAVNDEAPLRTFLASDLKKMRRVVLRLRSYVGRSKPEDFERLAVRLEPARELRHPNVAKVLEVQRMLVEHPRVTHEHHLLVSEYTKDPSLSVLIALGPMEPLRVARILRQILLACEAAHRRGLVHRLLYPEKIHIAAGREDHVRVRDFGLAVFLGATGKGCGLLGTAVLAYAPPEVLVADPCDHRADLYAAGAIAYAMLGGAPPFRWDVKRERMRSILGQTPVPLPAQVRARIPRELESLVMRLLAREPDDRPASARDAIDALDAIV